MIDVHNLNKTLFELSHDLLYSMWLEANSKGKERYVEVCIEDLSKYYNSGVLKWSKGIGCSIDERYNGNDKFYKDLVGYDYKGNPIYQLSIQKNAEGTVYFRGISSVIPIDVCFLPALKDTKYSSLKDVK